MQQRWLLLPEEAGKAVTELYTTQVSPIFLFHNLAHTHRVVAAAKEIMNCHQLKDEEQFVTLIAAWFHDTGFSKGHMEGHEAASIQIVTGFLRSHEVRNEIIAQVTACIEATSLPQRPSTLPAMIVCDADLFHLGTEEFPRLTELLRQEFEHYFGRPLSQQEWNENNIHFLQSHTYFTDYCRQKLEPVKQHWLAQCINNNQSNTLD